MAFALLHLRHRRRIAAAVLALLLQSLAWGAGAAGFADLLESEGATIAHEQGCLDDVKAPAGQQETDSACNDACHFWSQFQVVYAVDVAPAMSAAPVLRAGADAHAIDHRGRPPLRPPRPSLPV
ncbi:MAG TPA: hypothetical protein VHA15_16130 [Burkholderiales bacterium]|jgi:hypothetical protein|nr:hypothetical protein [Burkholderiales bacterium]